VISSFATSGSLACFTLILLFFWRISMANTDANYENFAYWFSNSLSKDAQALAFSWYSLSILAFNVVKSFFYLPDDYTSFVSWILTRFRSELMFFNWASYL
jgi:hypothetical protein